MEEKLQKNLSCILQFIDSTRFMAGNCQILSTIFLKEFIKLNVKTDMKMKNVEFVELNISIETVFLNTKVFKMI